MSDDPSPGGGGGSSGGGSSRAPMLHSELHGMKCHVEGQLGREEHRLENATNGSRVLLSDGGAAALRGDDPSSSSSPLGGGGSDPTPTAAAAPHMLGIADASRMRAEHERVRMDRCRASVLAPRATGLDPVNVLRAKVGTKRGDAAFISRVHHHPGPQPFDVARRRLTSIQTNPNPLDGRRCANCGARATRAPAIVTRARKKQQTLQRHKT